MIRFGLLLLRWKMELHGRLEAVWEGRRAGLALLACGTVVAGCLEHWVPAPGVAVAAMGVLAALMAARTKASGAEKAIWMLLISSLLVIEVLAIRKDRQVHDAELANLLSEEDENLKTATGGDSFCYLEAFSFAPTGVTMAAVCSGKYPIYGLAARVFDPLIFRQSHDITKATVWMQIGEMPASILKVIPQVVPFSGTEKQDFNVFFSARNGLWQQLIRYMKIDGRWTGATIVSTGVTRKCPKGCVVYRRVGENFPPDILAKDKDWQGAEELVKLTN